jgi:hypothetical protein
MYLGDVVESEILLYLVSDDVYRVMRLKSADVLLARAIAAFFANDAIKFHNALLRCNFLSKLNKAVGHANA